MFNVSGVTINCDNQGAIALSKDNKFHVWTEHIDIHYHFIHEVVEDGKIQVQYIPTDDNFSDIFTKPLAKTMFHHFIELFSDIPRTQQRSMKPEI